MSALSQCVSVVSLLPVEFSLKPIFGELFEVLFLLVSPLLDGISVELLLLEAFQSLLLPFLVDQLFPPQLLFQVYLLLQSIEFLSFCVVVSLV